MQCYTSGLIIMIHLAYFITPHGFGHAARATAVMLACLQKRRDLWFEVYTTVPQWFFDDSRLTNYTIHPLACDIGLVQINSLQEDLPATLRALESFYPISEPVVVKLSEEAKEKEIKAILCDISPLGISVAKRIHVPSVLIENFTWDWIYEGYLSEEPGFIPFIEYLKELYAQCSFHVQAIPFCKPEPCHLIVDPISRPIYTSREAIRTSLEIPQNAPVVLITMGGIESNRFPVEMLQKMPDTYFIVPGGASFASKQKNLILLPHRSGYYHTDLMNACDAVIGKLGYSTLAEACWTGVPYGYIPRLKFRESPPLARFVREEMGGIEIPEDLFWEESLLESVNQLLQLPRRKQKTNGADQIAGFLISSILQQQ